MNPRTRVLGLAILGCGALLCILPSLPWYSADLPTGADRLTGYGATAVTWILPVAGGMLVAAGLLAAWWQPSTGTRVARLLGGLVVVCAITAITWATRAALATVIQVVAERPGRAAAPPRRRVVGHGAAGSLGQHRRRCARGYGRNSAAHRTIRGHDPAGRPALVSRVINYVAVPGCVPSRCGVLSSPNMPDIGADLRPCLAGDSLGNCIRTYDSGH